MKKALSAPEFDSFLRACSDEFEFWGPVTLPNRGRFSDTPLTKFGRITSCSPVLWDEKTWLSPKEIVFPITQSMFTFVDGEVHTPEAPLKKRILLSRACDIHAISRLDNVFLHNGTEPDFYYKRLRDQLSFALIECAEPFDSCFCVSMGTNTASEFSAAVRKTGDSFVVWARDTFLATTLSRFGTEAEFDLKFPQENGADVKVPAIEKMPESLFTHELWEEYSKRCIACGRCNTSCPTCSCFSVQDFFYEENPANAERRRVWDGCHLDGFTDMAGGVTLRKEYGSRMRFKTFHKIYDYRKRFGVNMCVGCGRCDDVCPEYISFAACINKVHDVVEKGGAEHG